MNVGTVTLPVKVRDKGIDSTCAERQTIANKEQAYERTNKKW